MISNLIILALFVLMVFAMGTFHTKRKNGETISYSDLSFIGVLALLAIIIAVV